MHPCLETWSVVSIECIVSIFKEPTKETRSQRRTRLPQILSRDLIFCFPEGTRPDTLVWKYTRRVNPELGETPLELCDGFLDEISEAQPRAYRTPTSPSTSK
jgi:hypothetical protein